MTMTFSDFKGIPCVWLDNGHVRLAVTTQRGPRILFFGLSPSGIGGPAAGDPLPTVPLPTVGTGGTGNLLAELPDFVVGSFHFLGGHRLWAAPESLVHTYHPDDDPPLFRLADSSPERGVHLTTPGHDSQGIVKEMEIVLAEDAPEVTLTHTLSYVPYLPPPHHMITPPNVAPWALTMCRLGGVAILPLPHGPVDADGLLPNRFLALWPYTQVTDPRLTWGDRFLLIEARPNACPATGGSPDRREWDCQEPAPPFKVGWWNTAGWLGYWLPSDLEALGGDGILFTKHFKPVPTAGSADYPDMGCNAECYTNNRFIEIETLGPLATILTPLVHVETWRLHAGFPRPTPEMALPDW